MKLSNIISIAVVICILLNSCAKTFYPSGNSYLVSSIDSYGNYNLKGKTFVIASGMDGVNEKDLAFKEFADVTAKAIVRKGAINVSSSNNADLLILLQYGISDPQTYQENIPVPIFGITGISSATTTTNTRLNMSGKAYGSAYSTGGTTTGNIYGSSTTNRNSTTTTNYDYNYGVTGVYNKTVNRTIFNRYCNLYAFDNKVKSDSILWKTKIESIGSSGDLRVVLPYMVYTGMDYLGYNTGEKITLCTKDNNSVNILKETKLETSPYIIYAPKYSSNSKYICLTEVDFYSNETIVFFRVIGFSGMQLQFSKKNTMTVNDKEYPITRCSAKYKPDRLILQKDGQVYDFSMTFPAIDPNNVRSIKISESKKDGWIFSVEL